MTAQIDFWFTMGSTYTYLSVMRIADCQRSTGITFVDYSVSRPPLDGDAGPLQARWWKRIALSKSNARTLRRGPAVYIVYDLGAKAATYIGQTNGLRRRAAAHASLRWPIPEPWLAYLSLPERTPKLFC